MQDHAPRFTFTQLPAATTAALLRTYLSVFGEVESLDYNAEQHAATAVYSPSCARFSAIQFTGMLHRFMGMPIRVTLAPPAPAPAPAPASAPSSPSESDFPRSPSPNFRYYTTCCILRASDMSCLRPSLTLWAAACTRPTTTCQSSCTSNLHFRC